ncbi:type VI secretion system protein VasD [Orbus hercynius]|uniref:Type VI secretion system protein VasD n=1 Tax=Orbus hercynius TaxID=593135 RepID=A0A495RB35_9GAMM|nr:type VI secretion system lipoprotein TssJ [Orbus hercynius]RKS84470.1 type VI secretion system protein VasD [Orbus hercynius]
MKTLLIIGTLMSLFILSGCGAAQSVSEGTASVAKAIFVWDVRTVHLDFTARAELNTDDNNKSSPVVIRIYQLSDPQSFNSAPYPALVDGDQDALGSALLASKEIVLKPDTALSVDTPFDKNANYVGIVALFKEPDLKANSWRILLKRSDLHINDARAIKVNKFALELVAED